MADVITMPGSSSFIWSSPQQNFIWQLNKYLHNSQSEECWLFYFALHNYINRENILMPYVFSIISFFHIKGKFNFTLQI